MAQSSGSSSSSSSARNSSFTYLPGEKLAAFQNLNNFLTDPLAGAGSSIRTLLDALQPQEDIARRNLQDEFRKAGALGDGAFATSARQLENDIYKNRAEAGTRAALAFLGPLVSGYSNALQGIPTLSKSEGSSQSQSQGFNQSGDPSPSGLDRLDALDRLNGIVPGQPLNTGGAGRGGAAPLGGGAGGDVPYEVANTGGVGYYSDGSVRGTPYPTYSDYVLRNTNPPGLNYGYRDGDPNQPINPYDLGSALSDPGIISFSSGNNSAFPTLDDALYDFGDF